MTTPNLILVALLALGWAATARLAALWWRQLHTDRLTGLANRDHLVRAFRTACRRGGTVGLLVVDLDRFKQVNDTHGHHVGNALLRHIACRLHTVCQRSEVPVRLHGDEFAILLPGLAIDSAGQERAQQRARELAAAISTPMPGGEQDLAVTASVGVAVCAASSADLSALMRAADQRMYAHKARPDEAACVALPASVGRWS